MAVDAVFMQYPSVYVPEEQDKILRNGNPLRVREVLPESVESSGIEALKKSRIRVYDARKEFCAIYEYRAEKGLFYPVKMFL